MATTKKKQRATSDAASGVEHPCSIPTGATEFRMRKGGKSGPPCGIMRGLAEKFHHPLELFTAKEIVDRWGHGRDYWVQFYSTTDGVRQPLGGWRHLSFPDVASPEAEHHVAQVVPAGPGGPLGEGLSLLLTLKQITDSSANAQIQAAETRAQASLQSDRERSRDMMNLAVELFRMQAPKARTEDDPLLTMVRDLAEQNRTTQRALARLEESAQRPDDDDEEQEEPEETDDARVQRLVKLVRKEGAMAAVQEYFGEESVMTVIRLLPKIKAKIPEVIALLQPLLKDTVAQLEGPAQSAPRAIANPAPQPIPAPPTEIRARRRETPPPPAPDEFAVKVK